MSNKTVKSKSSNSAKEADFDIREIYTPLSVAKKEIWKRWNDKELRKKAEDFLGAGLSEVMKKEPRAVLSRGVLTPNLESKHFLDLAEMLQLNPACAEFSKDRFCSNNEDKIHLGKMVFFHKLNKNRDRIITRKSIIDFKTNENRCFSSIKTKGGEKFIDFHHRMFLAYYGKSVDTFDISIFKSNGERAKEVYKKLLALFICHGVLLENFINKDNHYEKKFTNNVVIPAFKEVVSLFKIKPLIAPVLPIKDEEEHDWMWYPGKLEKEVANSLYVK